MGIKLCNSTNNLQIIDLMGNETYLAMKMRNNSLLLPAEISYYTQKKTAISNIFCFKTLTLSPLLTRLAYWLNLKMTGVLDTNFQNPRQTNFR